MHGAACLAGRGVWASGGGQDERDLGASSRLAGGGQAAAVRVRELGGAGEADAGAGDLRGLVAAPEAVEDVGQLIGRDAASGVADLQPRFGPVALGNRILACDQYLSGGQAARRYSLIRPFRIGFRRIRREPRSAAAPWKASGSLSGMRWAMP
jgi:hypothetical protein